VAVLNIFDAQVTEGLIARINKLTAETKPQWGKMNAGQMLAHCCVAYEMLFEPERFPKPKGIMKLVLKLFVKSTVCGDKPYTKSLRTAPAFLVTTEKDFNEQKTRLINYLRKVQQLGAKHFDGKESHSFGVLTIQEWNNMFYKHLEHHFSQFGV
jgi:Protein of unknown function (DUF1569)